MKKLLTILPAVLALSACQTPATYRTLTGVEQFTCQNDASVNVQYSKNGSVAELNVNIPKLGLNNQPLTLKQAISASGTRYLNNENPASIYEWHSKKDEAVLSIQQDNGQEHLYSCKKS